MSLDISDIVRVVLPTLKAAHFAVAIEGDTDIVKAGFNRCEGLGGSLETATVDEPGDTLRRLYPYRGVNKPVTLIRGLDIDGFLYQWYRDARDWQPGRSNYRRDVSIYQLQRIGDNIAVARRGWDIYGAYPLEWSGPQLNSVGNDISFESVTLHYDEIEATPLIGAGYFNINIGG